MFRWQYFPGHYRYNTILIKTPAGFFAETNTLILKFIRNFKGHRVAKTILKKKRAKMMYSHFPIPKLTTKLQ